jgi:hypothetical protein
MESSMTKPGKVMLSYSANVHPGETAADLVRILSDDIPAVRDALSRMPSASSNKKPGHARSIKMTDEVRFGAAPRIGLRQADELTRSPEMRERVKAALAERDLVLFNVNAYPLVDFHAERVKENVYRPPWDDPARADCTIRIAELVADWLPPEGRASISTLTGRWEGELGAPPFGAMAAGIARVARRLAQLHDERGVDIVLGLEPEPFTTAESTAGFIRYYKEFILAAAQGGEADVRRHIGFCCDLCHMAVCFERPAEALAAVEAAGIRIACAHMTAAARVAAPSRNADGMARLRGLDEPRYLHQTYAMDADGRVAVREPDLPAFFARGPADWPRLREVRTHFHMPLTMDPDGPMGTTRGNIPEAVAFLQERGLCEHFLVETYTWNVLRRASDGSSISGVAGSSGEGKGSLSEDIAREIAWAGDCFKNKKTGRRPVKIRKRGDISGCGKPRVGEPPRL